MKKLYSAAKNWEINEYKHKQDPWGWDDPAYLSGALVISGLIDIPLDRLIYKIDNIKDAMQNEMEWWQTLARLAGYKEYEVEMKGQKEERKAKAKEERKEVKDKEKGPEFKSMKFKKDEFKKDGFK